MRPADMEEEEEYSASSTTIKFDRPIPLLREPTLSDDGTCVLAFKSRRSWASAYKACESNIIDQCEGGARIGCAISASNKCRLPWWRYLFGGVKLADINERERCEDREMEVCFVAAKEKCVGFARDKCSTPFRKARIVVGNTTVEAAELPQ